MLFNKNKVAGYLAFGSILLSAGACTKKLDTNANNPNAVTTTVISGKDVFASALQNTVFAVNVTPPPVTVGISTLTNEWMGIWARTTSYSAAGTQYLVETFTLNNAYGDNFWGYMYHNMADYNFVASKSADGSILPGASLVMQCLIFQDLTDIFGDIPYSQALNTKYGKPVYDKAADIYASLPLRLDSAMALINASKATSDDAADVMFKGNKASWLAFANTVKLRILLRQIPVAATAASLQAEMAKTASYGFLTAGQNAVVNPGYKDATNQQSPFWSVFGYQVASPNVYQNQTFYIANQTMVDYLNATSDPRLGYIYKVASGGGYAGNFLGDADHAKPVNQLATIGTGILKSPGMDAVVMTASEALFLQAEAAQRGLISGDFKALYNQAVSESFTFLGVPNPATAASSYLAANAGDPRIDINGADPIQAIVYGKWVANAEIDGLEIWSDYRKTGYPDRTNPSINPGAQPNQIPVRLLYPQTEITQNQGNYAAQNQQAGDVFNKKIFWQK